MRTRKEIEIDAADSRTDRSDNGDGATGTGPFKEVLEVLLDIRQLLIKNKLYANRK